MKMPNQNLNRSNIVDIKYVCCLLLAKHNFYSISNRSDGSKTEGEQSDTDPEKHSDTESESSSAISSKPKIIELKNFLKKGKVLFSF